MELQFMEFQFMELAQAGDWASLRLSARAVGDTKTGLRRARRRSVGGAQRAVGVAPAPD